MAPKIERILARLDIATSPEVMNLPGFKSHPLKGGHKGFWSIWVTGNWRIVFRFEGNHVFDVDLVDYH
ncbi:MAG: type II toxin-antitoxin system RelE/ParE family toxin [Nitrospinae bacterium]|nr:type II toxin-antitoxin system RelE/ParE family toxin [Nitrospinota bacterium]